jgi:hypothetical protein
MHIDRTNYILLVVKAVETIENFKDASNIENKKDVVMKALNRIVTIDLDLCEFDQVLILTSITNIIENIITCSKMRIGKNDKENFMDDNDDIEDIFLATVGQIIHSLVDKLTTIVLKKQYTPDKLFVNMGTITHMLMVLTEKYPYLTGCEKKIVVLQAIDNFFRERLEYIIELEADKKESLLMALDSVPLMIDIFIALQKGKYKINKRLVIAPHKTIWACFSKQNND